MTTPWTIPPLWAGETVAVLASGPSLTPSALERVRSHPCIAVHRAARVAPWAAMLLALDPPAGDPGFWEEHADFAGLRVCGTECELDALYLHLPHDIVTLGENHIVHIRNNGLAAIRVAAAAGAAKILLVGFDPESGGHFYDDRAWPYPQSGELYPGLTAGLAQLIATLRAQGVEVEYVAGDPPEAEPA